MILLIKRSIIGIKATLGRVPIALRPSLVYIILMLVSTIPMRLLHFPVRSIGSMIQFGFPVLMYFILAPVLAAMSIRQEDLSRRNLPALIVAGVMLFLCIPISRLAYFAFWENQYFTFSAIFITVVPFVVTVVATLTKIGDLNKD
ncbi:hypothetical protein [Actinomyces sp.]